MEAFILHHFVSYVSEPDHYESNILPPIKEEWDTEYDSFEVRQRIHKDFFEQLKKQYYDEHPKEKESITEQLIKMNIHSPLG